MIFGSPVQLFLPPASWFKSIRPGKWGRFCSGRLYHQAPACTWTKIFFYNWYSSWASYGSSVLDQFILSIVRIFWISGCFCMLDLHLLELVHLAVAGQPAVDLYTDLIVSSLFNIFFLRSSMVHRFWPVTTAWRALFHIPVHPPSVQASGTRSFHLAASYTDAILSSTCTYLLHLYILPLSSFLVQISSVGMGAAVHGHRTRVGTSLSRGGSVHRCIRWPSSDGIYAHLLSCTDTRSWWWLDWKWSGRTSSGWMGAFAFLRALAVGWLWFVILVQCCSWTGYMILFCTSEPGNWSLSTHFSLGTSTPSGSALYVSTCEWRRYIERTWRTVLSR